MTTAKTPLVIDFSTINLDELAKLPVYQLPPNYRLQRDTGNGCYGDPPGYPTYFTRSVYTSSGNNPPYDKTQMVVQGPESVHTLPNDYDVCQQVLRGLWKPLPLWHPRTIAWMRGTYAHFGNCYQHPTEKEYDRPKIYVWPAGGGLGATYGFRVFRDDPRFSEQWREKEQAAIAQHNAELTKRFEEFCVPENHAAARIIQQYYPEHQPSLEWIANRPRNPGNWWERYSAPPRPEECPGDVRVGMKHGGTWCQFCGWYADDPT